MKNNFLSFACATVVAPLVTTGAGLHAQASVVRTAPAREAITEERVREVVSFLASDSMQGRNTPSPGLEAAAEYIAAAFQKAGVQPGVTGKDGKKSYFHHYTLPGRTIVAKGVSVALRLADGGDPVALVAGDDVRVYMPTAEEFAREESTVRVIAESKAGRLRRSAPRNPILLTVDPKTSALWTLCAEDRQVMVRRRMGRAPILLVRKGAMPEGEIASADIRVAAAKNVTLKLRNVVGVLPGGARKDEFVLFSAHYDHVGVGLASGDKVFNGADDDATGTTAVVTLAEAFAKADPAETRDRSLMFVCFSAEEKGLLGSRAFAANPPVPLDKIAVNLNLEMLGRPDQIQPKQAWVTGREYSDFEDIVRVGFARAGVEVVEFERARALFGASDNASLARKGVVAHSISAGSLHQDYHQPSDEVKKLNLPHMTAVIQAIFEAGVEFARRAERPAYNEAGKRFTERRR